MLRVFCWMYENFLDSYFCILIYGLQHDEIKFVVAVCDLTLLEML